MASNRETREVAIVRRFLTHLADSRGNAAPGRKTIDHVAEQLDCDAASVRQFRDGVTEALPRTTVAAFAKLLGRGDDMAGVELTDYDMGDPTGGSGGWYRRMMSQEYDRDAKLRTFDHIDNTRGEFRQALNGYADLGTTGQVGDDARYAGGFEPVTFGASQLATKELRDAAAHINQNLMPDDEKWLAFRQMAKNGDAFGELGLGIKNGRYFIKEVAARHPRSMRVFRDDNGRFNPDKAFVQIMPGETGGRDRELAEFAAWQVMHLKNGMEWGALYGAGIADGNLRSWTQVEAMEAGMIIRRLERAAQRLKHFVDVGLIDGGNDAIATYVEKYRKRHRKVPVVDGNRNFRSQRINIPPEEDIHIPKRDKDSPADVEVLAGDAYIEEIGDFLHFFNRWLAGLGVPKGHLNYEDEGSKTGVNDKHIVFARRVRGMQLRFISGLNHLYWVALILRGIDPRTVRYTIYPPSLGTRDELVRAQVQQAKATTVQYLAKSFGLTGKVPSTEWFLQYVMGLDEEAIDNLDLVKVMMPAAKGAGMKNDPAANGPQEGFRETGRSKRRTRAEKAELGDIALANPAIQEVVEHAQFILQERMIGMRLPQAERLLGVQTKPFGKCFDETVRSLGIKHLRSAA